MKRIIDTNVPVIANGDQSPQVSLECRLSCVRLLGDWIDRRQFRLVVDVHQIVLREYRNNLRPQQGKIGDRFLYEVLSNLAKAERCTLVQITPEGDSFAEFPNDDSRLTTFDPADRKWIAVALAHKRDQPAEDVPPIAQAADPKWKNFTEAFSEHGVTIDFICD